MVKLRPEETELIGHWTDTTDYTVRDPTSDRINNLISEYLREIAQRDGGWTVLYKDPSDGRYWELTYPESAYHGGGPPRLTNLTPEQVRERYGHIPDST